jgi:uncharacterized protein
MITRHLITQRADADGVDPHVVERDYVLAHVVAQLSASDHASSGRLIFKGGTALRMIHVGDYRYSADLDFSIVDIDVAEALVAIDRILAAARDHAEFPMLELSETDKPKVLYVGPLRSGKARAIKLDLADDELVENVQLSAIRSTWPDLPPASPLNVYTLDEIAAEKLRCIIQRVQCRDLFDLFQLLTNLGVSAKEIRPLFERKARHKNVDPIIFAERFEMRLRAYRDGWDDEMSEHVPRGAHIGFEEVVRAVRRQLRDANLVGNSQ